MGATERSGRTVFVVPLLLACLVAGAWAWTPDLDRRTLEARYLAAPNDMIEVAGTRLHVRDDGPRAAQAVVFLHGFGASLHTWEPWARDLRTAFRVVRFDLPGSGLSPPDTTGDYTDGRSVALLAALLDRLGIERATLVGHSIGGRIAFTFAARHPDRVDRLVLISPDGFQSDWFRYGQRPHVPASAKLMRYVLPKSLLHRTLARAYADPTIATAALVDRYHDLARAPGARDALLARMAQTVLVDPVPLLRTIRAPTLLLWGERDALIPFANSAEYLKALPQATLAPLAGIGHVPQEEAPRRALEPLAAFLRQADTGRPVPDPSAPRASSAGRPAPSAGPPDRP
jgi:pimeloyl-ACP methyl ester carboxylesterase